MDFDSLPFFFLSHQAIDLMVVDALTLANGELGISESIQEPAKFWKVCLSLKHYLQLSSAFQLLCHYSLRLTIAL